MNITLTQCCNSKHDICYSVLIKIHFQEFRSKTVLLRGNSRRSQRVWRVTTITWSTAAELTTSPTTEMLSTVPEKRQQMRINLRQKPTKRVWMKKFQLLPGRRASERLPKVRGQRSYKKFFWFWILIQNLKSTNNVYLCKWHVSCNTPAFVGK